MKFSIIIAFLLVIVFAGDSSGQSFKQIRERQRAEVTRYNNATKAKIARAEKIRVDRIRFRNAERRVKQGRSTLIVNKDGSWTEIRHNYNRYYRRY